MVFEANRQDARKIGEDSSKRRQFCVCCRAYGHFYAGSGKTVIHRCEICKVVWVVIMILLKRRAFFLSKQIRMLCTIKWVVILLNRVYTLMLYSFSMSAKKIQYVFSKHSPVFHLIWIYNMNGKRCGMECMHTVCCYTQIYHLYHDCLLGMRFDES